MTPRVSINLSCFNSERFLEETLQSIFAQTTTEWELVVVNDGSTDSTEQIVLRHVVRGRPIVYHAQANRGLAASRNQAIALSSGEFIAFIDHDDLWEPSHLEKLLEAFADCRVGLAYTDVLNLDGDRRRPVCRLSDTLKPAHGEAFFALVPGPYINPSMAMVRRSVLDEVGLFDESYQFVEESDLFLRIARRYRLAYVDQPLTLYRYHEGNLSNRFPVQQNEVDRFHRTLLERYPDIRTRLPDQEARWEFHRLARRFRYELVGRRYARACWELIRVLVQSFSIPMYAFARMRAYVSQRAGIRATIDWIR